MAIASLGRNDRFDAAVIGNSHVAPLSPHRLSTNTGLEFVSLTLPGASVQPELQLLKWFLTHRKAPPKLIVVGIDDVWCRQSPKYAEEPALPTWLISDNPLSYAAKLFRYDSVEQAVQRFTNSGRSVARPPDPRGFWDLELDYKWEEEKIRSELAKPWIHSINLSGSYPALGLLQQTLSFAPPDVAVALIMLPVWADTLPQGGAELISEGLCKRAFKNFAESLNRGIFIDRRKADTPTKTPKNFFDRTHYRAPIAEQVEAELIQEFQRLL
ncbi:hypothetical protein FQV39_16375 [Bosea sp. F3-2]|uniref:hypothetical protein n=1 Tax=Bosea sp. F3-2 TaxID=2599640 RepID=UPI0011EDAE59|nr:hypothetical protein [Bosea sp. F3-2]QEL23975.1 hypothetical protein FQV39_16375 [Bosea sp. F3-2]